MKVLDATFLIDLMRNNRKAILQFSNEQGLFTTQINMYEVLKGLFRHKVSKQNLLEIMQIFEDIRVLPLDDGAIITAAEIAAQLSSEGKIISDCDILTAGIALSRGMNTIITRNVKDFQRIKGIIVQSY